MKNRDYKELKELLEQDYFMIKKGRFWYLLGGLIGFLILTGVVSWQASLKVVKTTAAAAATREIINMKKDAEIALIDLNKCVERCNEELSSFILNGDTISIKGRIGKKFYLSIDPVKGNVTGTDDYSSTEYSHEVFKIFKIE